MNTPKYPIRSALVGTLAIMGVALGGTAVADIILTPAEDPAAVADDPMDDTPLGSATQSALQPLVSFSAWAEANNLPDVSPLSAAAGQTGSATLIWLPIVQGLIKVWCGAESFSGGNACETASSHNNPGPS
ncbi:hypothetical protein H0264_32245 [Nocardia huaxiensis]|uniref:Uncharacterized protein n=1 Tax=Nocardia huaxiensis TaxID=2755382 RepID=A0A7D6VGV6_9NOCA|nr:hypothetical protein [Nocardia huaxiensis]QLY29836.1 hypothetical protein H0264_32245 [Nocardia huaxiensis]